ncbi:plasmalemma vesicle associated protein b isoform X2 [Ictalurus punctatus]|uniref:Plasmalemma vesicle associated protein b isoform X2 n=1 Tax=Ictalurus punctatus TaxID=7998 RepID=A0A979F213_ICTPU|nr:plasmalemma vesicle associated protein b isoform X2 [Ictalurus punctatus]
MYNNNYTRPKSLIIVSLVLFLVYGQPAKSADEKRVEELELSFSKLSSDNTNLRKEKADLIAMLKTKTAEKDAADKKVVKITADLDAAKVNNTKCLQALAICNKPPIVRCPGTLIPSSVTNEHVRTLQILLDQQKSLYAILQANFSQTVQNLRFDLDNAVKDKNKHEMAMIKLKQEKDDLTSELQLYKKKCKEDFVMSLRGIQDVTTAFLTKIDNLFPDTFTFHLTCSKQQEQMQKIHANCTNLSRQVEDKFQNYLNSVGDKVSALQARSSRLEVENKRLTSDNQNCSQSRAQDAEKCLKRLQEAQESHDNLMESQLNRYKQLLQEKQRLDTTCITKPPVPKPNGMDPYMIYGQSAGNRLGQMGVPGLHTAVQSKPGSSQPPKTR